MSHGTKRQTTNALYRGQILLGGGSDKEAGSALGQGQPNGSTQPKSNARNEVTLAKHYGNLV